MHDDGHCSQFCGLAQLLPLPCRLGPAGEGVLLASLKPSLPVFLFKVGAGAGDPPSDTPPTHPQPHSVPFQANLPMHACTHADDVQLLPRGGVWGEGFTIAYRRANIFTTEFYAAIHVHQDPNFLVRLAPRMHRNLVV